MSHNPASNLIFGIDLKRPDALKFHKAVSSLISAQGASIDDDTRAYQVEDSLGWSGFRMAGHGADSRSDDTEWLGDDDTHIDQYAVGFLIPASNVVQTIKGGASAATRTSWASKIKPILASIGISGTPKFIIVSQSG